MPVNKELEDKIRLVNHIARTEGSTDKHGKFGPARSWIRRQSQYSMIPTAHLEILPEEM